MTINPDNERKTSAHETNEENVVEQEKALGTSSNEKEIKTKPIAEHGEDAKEEAQERNIVKEMEIVEQYEEKTAGFWIRFWAFLTDGLIVGAIISIFIKPIFYFLGLDLFSSDWYAPITIVSGIIYYGYFILMTKFWQQTIGKMIFGIKVKPLKEEKLSWGTVLFREFVSRFINNTIWITYLFVVIAPKNKGIQDFIADTIVVHENVYVKNEQKIFKEKIIDINPSNEQTV